MLTQIVLTSAASDPLHLHKWQLGLAKCLAATGQAREAMVLLQQALGQQRMAQETSAAMLRMLVDSQVRLELQKPDCGITYLCGLASGRDQDGASAAHSVYHLLRPAHQHVSTSGAAYAADGGGLMGQQETKRCLIWVVWSLLVAQHITCINCHTPGMDGTLEPMCCMVSGSTCLEWCKLLQSWATLYPLRPFLTHLHAIMMPTSSLQAQAWLVSVGHGWMTSTTFVFRPSNCTELQMHCYT